MKSLLLITHWYPLNRGDSAFISSEIEYVAKRFDVIHVLCQNSNVDAQNTFQVPENVIVHIYRYRFKNIIRLLLLPVVLVSPLFYSELLKQRSETAKINIKILIGILAFAINAFYYKRIIKKILKKNNIKLVYTYWYSSAALAAILLKRKFGIKCITRTHGGDLYLYQSYQPFKKYMDKHLDKIYFINKNGYEYYLNIFANSNLNKYNISKLGTKNTMEINYNRTDKFFNIISCSYMVETPKRICFIISALSVLDEIDLVWTHVGDGPDWEYVTGFANELLKEKKNITYNFTGYMDNSSILNLYKNKYFDCFISTSESEGLPVSMMEAISFGIPIIGTNVGGVSEIVNKHTGILLNVNPSREEIKNAILRLYNLSPDEKIMLRKSARTFWEENFNAEKNYTKFSEDISNI
jgi:glycosyltransferase involved in cell wall biosynthesis